MGTSKPLASLAGKVLEDDKSTKIEKELAGSDLSLVIKGNEASVEIKSKAGKVLEDKSSSENGKELAASILAQSKDENKEK